MDNHSKKKIAPIIITIILLFYFVFYFSIVMVFAPGIIKVLFAVIPLVSIIGIVLACQERLKEIDGGEEDDLSKY